MSANANDMTKLINKIERRLGLIPITPHLPKEFNKEAWAETIKIETLPTFSRYFPNKILYACNKDTVISKNGWYYLRDDVIGNNIVLGVADIDWDSMGSDNLSLNNLAAYGYPETYGYSYYGMSSVLMDQAIGLALNANINSLFTNANTIYVETDEGNPMRFRLASISGQDYKMKNFLINVLLEHKDLVTISPTKMNTFEALATADVANFLYENLKYYDGLETIFATIDLKLNDLSQKGANRDQIIDKLENSYVSAANINQPLMVVN